MMYNVANKERFNFRACVARGDCAPHSHAPPIHELGKTFSIVESIDDRKKAALLEMYSEASDQNGTQVYHCTNAKFV